MKRSPTPHIPRQVQSRHRNAGDLTGGFKTFFEATRLMYSRKDGYCCTSGDKVSQSTSWSSQKGLSFQANVQLKENLNVLRFLTPHYRPSCNLDRPDAEHICQPVTLQARVLAYIAPTSAHGL